MKEALIYNIFRNEIEQLLYLVHRELYAIQIDAFFNTYAVPPTEIFFDDMHQKNCTILSLHVSETNEIYYSLQYILVLQSRLIINRTLLMVWIRMSEVILFSLRNFFTLSTINSRWRGGVTCLHPRDFYRAKLRVYINMPTVIAWQLAHYGQ